MTTRQYIGARYIPVFADPVEWDNTRTYEHLMMVQHQGDTYISQQAVPIGIDLPDISQGESSNAYWVHMSDWNAQVEAYRQEVLQYNGRISTLESDLPLSAFDSTNTVDARFDAIEADSWVSVNRIANNAVTTAKIADSAVTTSKIPNGAITKAKIATEYLGFIGDSFAYDGVIPDGVASHFGLTAINVAQRGAGFLNHSITGEDSFIEQATRLLNNPNYSQIKKIIVYGGVNDIANASGDDINSAAATLAAYLKTNFPGVEIYYFIFNAPPSYYQYLGGKLDSTVTVLNRAGGGAVNGKAYLWFFNEPGLLESSDHLHPTAAGKQCIIGRMISSMNGDSSIRRVVDVSLLGSTTSTGYNANMQDGMIYIFGQFNVTPLPAGDFQDFLDFSSSNNGIIMPGNARYGMATTAINSVAGNLTGMIRNNGHLSIFNPGSALTAADECISAVFPVCQL